MISFGESILYLLLFFGLIFSLSHVLVSPKIYGRSKLGWLIAVILFPWVGYIVFLLFTSEAKVEQDGW